LPLLSTTYTTYTGPSAHPWDWPLPVPRPPTQPHPDQHIEHTYKQTHTYTHTYTHTHTHTRTSHPRHTSIPHAHHRPSSRGFSSSPCLVPDSLLASGAERASPTQVGCGPAPAVRQRYLYFRRLLTRTDKVPFGQVKNTPALLQAAAAAAAVLARYMCSRPRILSPRPVRSFFQDRPRTEAPVCSPHGDRPLLRLKVRCCRVV